MIKIVCWSFLLLAGSYGLPLDSDVDTSMYFGNIDPVLIESSVAGPVPYMVAVTHGLAPRVLQCGASLITTRHFLTTAGCVYFTGESRRHLQGTVGTNLWNSGGTHYSVVRVIIHREYSIFTYKNDISILVTSSEVKLSEAVQPVVLNYDFIPAKVAAVVNGWGVTNVTEFKSPTMLMELQTNIVDGKECAADIADLAKKLKRPVHHVNPELEICAFHSAKSGVCYGDGGSPLVLKENRQQIGIVSWGIICAKGVPDVYTRISAFKSWIQKNTIL